MKVKILCISAPLLLIFNVIFSQNIIRNLEKVADSIYYNHDDHTTAKEFKEAFRLYDKELNNIGSNKEEHYEKLRAKKLAAKSAYLEHMMQPDSAIVYSNKSLKVQNNLTHQNLLLKGLTYKRLYWQWGKLNNMDSMQVYIKKSQKAFKDTLGDNHKLIADNLFRLGFVYGRKGSRDKNIEYYNKGIAMNIATDGEFTPDAAIQEHHLAITYGFVGFYKKELESYKKVVKRWEGIKDYKDMSYLSVAYTSLVTWYLQHGDVDTAEKYLLKNETLVNSRKKDLRYWFNETYKGRTQVNIWYNKTNIALFKKDTARAIQYNNKILEFVANFDENDKSNNPHNLSYFKNFVDLAQMAALRMKAKVLKSKAPEKANELYEQVVKILDNDDSPTTGLSDKLNIADYYINTNNIVKAKSLLDNWVEIAKNKKSDIVLMQLDAKNAAILVKEDQLNSLDSIYDGVFKKMQQDPSRNIAIEDLKNDDCKPYGDKNIIELILKASDHYAEAYQTRKRDNDLKRAYNLSNLASNAFSNNFGHLPYNESTYTIVSQINERLLNTAILRDDIAINDVLETIERSSSKLSWKKFLNSKQRKYLNIPDSITQKESELNAELNFYKKALFNENKDNKEKIALYKEKLFDVENEIERLEQWFFKNYAEYYNQTIKAFELKEIKQKLKRKQKVIKYVFADEFVYAFEVTNDTTRVHRISSKVTLTKKVKTFIKTLNELSNNNYKKLAQELYTILLPHGTIQDEKQQHLIFIQDDILNYMPMEALMGANEKYLIQAHKVSYVPSLLLFNEQLNVKKARKNKLGIFAPSYKEYYQKNPKRNDSTALFGAFNEAMHIATIFKSDVYSGDKASKQEFVNNAGNYSLLHLAMHSTINDKNVEFSHLSFSPETKNNKLFVSELYNMSLNADLAVLSACNTGAGELRQGEGLINVSRAFTYAGVPSIISSLWNVPDLETSEIMISFYEHLKASKSKDEALMQAKLDYLNTTNDAVLKHPYYWAGFIVSGDVSPIASTSNYWWLYGVFIAALLVIVFRKKLLKFF